MSSTMTLGGRRVADHGEEHVRIWLDGVSDYASVAEGRAARLRENLDANAGGVPGELEPGTSCKIAIGDRFEVNDVDGNYFSLSRATPMDHGTDQERLREQIERANPRTQIAGQRPSLAGAGQHLEESDGRGGALPLPGGPSGGPRGDAARRARAGDAFLRTLADGPARRRGSHRGRALVAALSQPVLRAMTPRQPRRSPSAVEIGVAARFMVPRNPLRSPYVNGARRAVSRRNFGNRR
jgi:hypothetical protein